MQNYIFQPDAAVEDRTAVLVQNYVLQPNAAVEDRTAVLVHYLVGIFWTIGDSLRNQMWELLTMSSHSRWRTFYLEVWIWLRRHVLYY